MPPSTPELKRVLILTADAGFGHRSAAKAIAAALKELHGDACSVDIANPLSDKRVPPVLRAAQDDYDKLVTTAPKLFGIGYELSDNVAPAAVVDGALTVLLFEALYRLVRRMRPDVIVTTYPLYQAPLLGVSQIRRRHIPLITVVTDLTQLHALWFHGAADLCLVPTSAARDVAVKHGIAPGKVEITGVPVHPRVLNRPNDRAALRAELGWQPDLTTALVVGSKRVGNLQKILRTLNHAMLPLQIAAVAGGDDLLYADLQAMEWHLPVHLYNYVEDLPALLHAADCLLCKPGGLIVSEALAVGLPMIFIDALPAHELANAEYVISHGAGAWAREPIAALDVLYHWLAADGALMAQHAVQARRLGRPRAAHDVAERAWTAAQLGEQPTPRHYRTMDRSRLMGWLRRHNIEWQEESLGDE
jgi:1,2-diacylglycerol 3-beta-galactosyltransferase